MQIIPVIDISQGIVVHAIAGQRHNYQPLKSLLFPGCDPRVFIQGFHAAGYQRIYLADLDAITRNSPHLTLLNDLKTLPISLLLDLGIRTTEHLHQTIDQLHGWPAHWTLILASESWEQPLDLPDLIPSGIPLCYSLDLHQGQIRSASGHTNFDDLLEQIINSGIRELIVLDTAAVGKNAGPTTLESCQQIRKHAPTLTILTGGGVRNLDDLHQLNQIPVDAALIATALHHQHLPFTPTLRQSRD